MANRTKIHDLTASLLQISFELVKLSNDYLCKNKGYIPVLALRSTCKFPKFLLAININCPRYDLLLKVFYSLKGDHL